MRDCDHCKRSKDGSCGMLECQGYVYLPQPSNEDKENYKQAQLRSDMDKHPQPRYGSRRFAEAEERIKQKPNIPASIETQPKPKQIKHTVEPGMVLYFKNRFTGHIQHGKVTARGWKHFAFSFNNKTVKLPYGVIGTRLFYSEKTASEKGRFTGP